MINGDIIEICCRTYQRARRFVCSMVTFEPFLSPKREFLEIDKNEENLIILRSENKKQILVARGLKRDFQCIIQGFECPVVSFKALMYQQAVVLTSKGTISSYFLENFKTANKSSNLQLKLSEGELCTNMVINSDKSIIYIDSIHCKQDIAPFSARIFLVKIKNLFSNEATKTSSLLYTFSFTEQNHIDMHIPAVYQTLFTHTRANGQVISLIWQDAQNPKFYFSEFNGEKMTYVNSSVDQVSSSHVLVDYCVLGGRLVYVDARNSLHFLDLENI